MYSGGPQAWRDTKEPSSLFLVASLFSKGQRSEGGDATPQVQRARLSSKAGEDKCPQGLAVCQAVRGGRKRGSTGWPCAR